MSVSKKRRIDAQAPLQDETELSSLEKLDQVKKEHDQLVQVLFGLDHAENLIDYNQNKILEDFGDDIASFKANYQLKNDFNTSSAGHESNCAKIKLKVGNRKKINNFTSIDHIPRQTKFDGNLSSWLNSFKLLTDEGVSIEQFNKIIGENVKIRSRMNKLSIMDLYQEVIPKFIEPARPPAHHNHLLSHAIYFAKLLNIERKSHYAKARKISQMVQVYFNRLSGADEKLKKEQERRSRGLAKKISMLIKQRWKFVEKVVEQRKITEIEEESKRIGKEHLSKILQRSSELLGGLKSSILGQEKSMISQIEPMAKEISMMYNEQIDNVLLSENESDSTCMDSELESEALSEIDSGTMSESGSDKAELRTFYNSHMMESNSLEESNWTGAKIDDLTSAKIVEKPGVPFLLRAELREYQLAGFRWLVGLYNNNTNGILADEMGLGKTVQTIALLAHLACVEEKWGPHLIIVPTSVMLNWEMEFKKFLPSFKVLTYYGNPLQRKDKRKGWNRENAFNVCVTSYQLVLHDQHVFKRKKWQYLVLDEAHNIKNFKSQRWQKLLTFNSEYRLLLTGTPLQNNLTELWSLLYFLMPHGLSSENPAFADLKNFSEWFSKPVEMLAEDHNSADQEEAKSTVQRLHTVLRPYVLRRLKIDVEKQLPAKYEHTIYCKLSKRQKFLYDDFMSRAQTRATLASGNFMSIINCLMQLRKVCNHPDLFEVRPIKTSFAMNESVVTYYQHTDNIVKRELLDIRKSDSEYVKIFEESRSKSEAINLTKLGNIRVIKNEHMQQEELILTKVEDYNRYISNKLLNERIELLQAQNRISQHRCNKTTLFGIGFYEMVTIKPKLMYYTELEEDEIKVYKQIYLHKQATHKAQNLVKSYETRFHEASPIFQRFITITPAVVARNLASLYLASLPVQNLSEKADLLHEANTCLSIAFPDKRLLQYDCGKLQSLHLLLLNLIPKGHRALIFSQMTKMLDILEQFLNIHGYRYLRLDGATRIEQRQILTERFNQDTRIPIFILSSRSGGLGINLTGADTVIFYDSDWNPCMDRQCQDRCHRIGQVRDVHIYRLVSEFTIEENILKIAKRKSRLDDLVLGEGEFNTDFFFNKQDIQEMLGSQFCEDDSLSLEKALMAAEDHDDADAARLAQNEIDATEDEFAEVVKQKEPDEATSICTESAADSQVGHVDNYMIRVYQEIGISID